MWPTRAAAVNQAISERYGYEVTGCEEEARITELVRGTFYVCDGDITATIDVDGYVYGGEAE